MNRIEEMSDRELLEELLKEKRRNQIIRCIELAILIAAVVFIYIEAQKYIPMIKDFVERSNGTIDKLKEMIVKLNDLMKIFNF